MRRLKEWLIGIVKIGLAGTDVRLDVLVAETQLLMRLNENLVRQNGLLLEELEKVRAEQERQAGDMESLHLVFLDKNKETYALVAEAKEGIDRLEKLITPKVARLQGRQPVGGWDQIVEKNLEQFEEKNDGVRR